MNTSGNKDVDAMLLRVEESVFISCMFILIASVFYNCHFHKKSIIYAAENID